MKILIVSSRSEIENIDPKEKIIHLAFRPNNVDMINLIQRCPRLRAIQLPNSYRRTISDAITVFTNMQGIELLTGDVWGHRKDLSEYFIVTDSAKGKILAFAKKGMPVEEIAGQIKEELRLSPDLIRYVMARKG